MASSIIVDGDRLGAITDLRSGRRWPSSALAAEIVRCRGVLAEHGVGPGKLVVIGHGGSAEFFCELLAAWSLGACAVCLNASLTLAELENIVTFVEPAVVSLRGGGHQAVAGVTVINPDDLQRYPERMAAAQPETIAIDEDAPALILFTSGTTGDPKGVVHNGRSLGSRIALNRRFIGDDTLARSLCVLPTHFGHGLIGNCLTPLSAGGDLFLYPAPGVDGTAQLAGLIDKHEITFMSSVPSFWRVVTRLCPGRPLPSLRRVHVGSAPLSAEHAREIQQWCGREAELWNMYGLTETANWVAGARIVDEDFDDGLVGSMWGGRAAVRGHDGNILASGEGEIVLDTPSCMAGYFRRDDLTASAIDGGCYRTGDYGAVDEHGVIRLLGRLKTEINRAGMKILPEEIDLLLERHPAVEEACTFGMPDPLHGERVAVAVVLTTPAASDPSALRDWCRERIRDDAVPEQWFVVDAIPKTDRGKINRDHVRRACTGEDRPAPAVPIDTPTHPKTKPR